MKTIYIRHNINVSDETLNKLKSKKLIAVHYANKKSVFPKDYKSNAAKRALKKLLECCESGAIVGADYGKSMLVGSIRPNSRIKIKSLKDDKRKEILHLKTVKLRNVREVFYSDYPLLIAIQPRQTTITGWPSAAPTLEAILNNHLVPFRVESLAPSQLEVICYEYLKMKKIIEVLLMPIGRTLRDIDILGFGSGKTVVAQVTYSQKTKEIKEKICKLQEYKKRNYLLIFFGPQSQAVKSKGVKYISVERVFDSLKSSNKPIYGKMLIKMLR